MENFPVVWYENQEICNTYKRWVKSIGEDPALVTLILTKIGFNNNEKIYFYDQQTFGEGAILSYYIKEDELLTRKGKINVLYPYNKHFLSFKKSKKDFYPASIALIESEEIDVYDCLIENEELKVIHRANGIEIGNNEYQYYDVEENNYVLPWQEPINSKILVKTKIK